MRILTWNINSVRLRAPLLKKIAREGNPDVICLQETKVVDELFPMDEIVRMGYPHVHINGMKSYNGVAILSKTPFVRKAVHDRVAKNDCRHISVQIRSRKFKTPLEIHNLYIPAGGDVPDRKENEKFAHKLDFVDEVGDWFAQNYTVDQPLIALGDFNIAPLEHDVWSHKQLLDVVSHTPIEVEKLLAMQEKLGWQDAIRHFVPPAEKCYTWWSYRNRDWKKSNRGRRLDHIWLTRPVMAHLKEHHIMTKARDAVQPSDHVPVMIDVNL
ncbi:MAG: exodeoxyribonuclease III [Micavibrio sp.]